MAVPSKYHWLPVGALLVSTLPDTVTTGAAGIELIVTLKLAETAPLPQVFDPFTVITPVPVAGPKVTRMFLVPAPEVITAPAGTVQI